jgi:hypothetical protein
VASSLALSATQVLAHSETSPQPFIWKDAFTFESSYLCGVPLVAEITFAQAYANRNARRWWSGELFSVAGEKVVKWTNPENGKSVTINVSGRSTEAQAYLGGGWGLWEMVTTGAAVARSSDGGVFWRGSGRVGFRLTYQFTFPFQEIYEVFDVGSPDQGSLDSLLCSMLSN